MGQKAKNAGKKQSKTCNKKATAKSVCGGKCFKSKRLTPIQTALIPEVDSHIPGFGRVIKTNGVVLINN